MSFGKLPSDIYNRVSERRCEVEETKYVPWDVHNEFARRIEEQEKRQDARLSALDAEVKEMTRLAISVEKMAVSMENMTAEQKEISTRLKAIEEKPAKRWDAVVGAIIAGVVGLLFGLITAGVIH